MALSFNSVIEDNYPNRVNVSRKYNCILNSKIIHDVSKTTVFWTYIVFPKEDFTKSNKTSTYLSRNQSPDIDKSIEFIDNQQMALIGYARVSTTDQHLHLQQDALQKAACIKIFTDTISGSTTERPGLDEALAYLRAGDTLVVWRLDRLGRSLKHLIETVTILQEKSIGFKSLTEQIDTGTSGGKLIFHILAIFGKRTQKVK